MFQDVQVVPKEFLNNDLRVAQDVPVCVAHLEHRTCRKHGVQTKHVNSVCVRLVYAYSLDSCCLKQFTYTKSIYHT